MYITYSSCYYGRRFGVRVWEVRMQGWRCEGLVWGCGRLEEQELGMHVAPSLCLIWQLRKCMVTHSVDHFTGLFHALFRCPACLKVLGVKGHLHKLHSKAGFWHPVSICVFYMYKTSVSTYMHLCLAVSMAVTPSFVHCLGALNGIMKA